MPTYIVFGCGLSVAPCLHQGFKELANNFAVCHLGERIPSFASRYLATYSRARGSRAFDIYGLLTYELTSALKRMNQ